MILKIIIAVTIHLVIPLMGLTAFLQLKKTMKKQGIVSAPVLDLFIIFITYGGLLLVTLTSLFWKWSALASLGTLYLLLVAPILMGIIGFRQFKKRGVSTYNKRVFQFSLIYFIVAPLVFLSLYLTDGLK